MQHLEELKQQLKQTRDLDIVSSSFKQLMVLDSSLLNHLYLYLMLFFQVHANILSAIVGVDWHWKSAVSGIMGLSTAPTGSVLDFDLGWRLAAVRQAELSCCVWVQVRIWCIVSGKSLLLVGTSNLRGLYHVHYCCHRWEVFRLIRSSYHIMAFCNCWGLYFWASCDQQPFCCIPVL